MVYVRTFNLIIYFLGISYVFVILLNFLVNVENKIFIDLYQLFMFGFFSLVPHDNIKIFVRSGGTGAVGVPFI